MARWRDIEVTVHFEKDTLVEHPEVQHLPHRIREALEAPSEVVKQLNGRTRRWVYCPEVDRYLRVVVMPDGQTVHTAFFDRNYKPK
jgi:hypothetical protein